MSIAPAPWRVAGTARARVGAGEQTWENIGRTLVVVAVVTVGGLAAAGAYAGYRTFGPWGLLGGIAVPAVAYWSVSDAWKDAPAQT